MERDRQKITYGHLFLANRNGRSWKPHKAFMDDDDSHSKVVGVYRALFAIQGRVTGARASKKIRNSPIQWTAWTTSFHVLTRDSYDSKSDANLCRTITSYNRPTS